MSGVDDDGVRLVLRRSDGGREGRWLAAVLACAALLLVACTPDRGDPRPPPAVTSAPGPDPSVSVSLSPAQAAERDALAAYRGMWEDFALLSETADYQNPRLADHASGDALSLLYQGLYANSVEGLVTRGRPVLYPEVSAATPEAEPDRATVVDCADSTDWLTYRRDGQLADDVPGGHRTVQALAVLRDGTWRIDQLVVQAVGTC